MHTLILVALICLGISVILFVLKNIELKFSLPKWYLGLRDRVDNKIETSLHMTHSTYRSFVSEIKEAISRTPHLIVHIGILLRDRLRIKFSKYIDEVKGRKPLADKKSNSEFLHAMKDYKEEKIQKEVE
jgi:hypothetical protein